MGNVGEAFAAASTTVQAAWRFDLAQGRTVRSTLTAVNRCRAPHRFRIAASPSLGFLRFLDDVEALEVVPGQGRTVGLEFSSVGLDLGLHQGEITVSCLDCAAELACTQDRDLLPVVMKVIAPEGVAAVPAAEPMRKGCDCTLKKGENPDALCRPAKPTLKVQYDGKGKDTTTKIEALLERFDGKALAAVGADEVKPNPLANNKWPCLATKQFEWKPEVTKPGRYKVTVSAACAKDKVEHEFFIVELKGVTGPGKLYLPKKAKKAEKKVDGEWQAEVDPLGAPGISWAISATGKAPLPAPSKGTGATAKATFGEPGAYKITFRCGKEEKSKDVVVEEAEAAIGGPSMLCFKLSGEARCAELARTAPDGEWTLELKPSDPGVRWRLEIYEKGGLREVARGQGPVAKATLANPACYRVSFWGAEGGAILVKEVLAYRVDLDVVVDGDLTAASASPAPVPIYVDRPGAVCSQLDLQQCRGFAMRYRTQVEPAIPVDFAPTGGAVFAWDTDDADQANAFTGEFAGVRNCEADTVRDDEFTLTVTADASLSLTVTNPKSGEREKGGEIRIKAAPPLADILLLEGQAKEIKALVKGNRVRNSVYFVRDSAGHQTPLWDGANEAARQVEKMYAVANTYWSQCGICFERQIAGNLAYPADLAERVDAQETAALGEEAGKSEGRPRATVSFVHEVERARAVTVSATSPGRPFFYISFGDPGGRALSGAILAHEFLHGIAGLPEDHAGQKACDLGVGVSGGLEDGLISAAQCQTAVASVSRRLSIETDSDLGAVKKNQSLSLGPLRALGGQAPLAWALAEPDKANLPEGVSLTAAGLIAGTPKSEGKYTFAVKVSDAAGATASARLRLEVKP